MKRIASAVLVVTLAGCASGGTSTADPTAGTRDELISGELGTVRLLHDDITSSGEFDAPRDKVWDALLAVHKELGLPLSSADAAAGRLTFQLRTNSNRIAGKRASTYIDCGQGSAGNNADSHSITVRLTETVTSESENRTAVRITLLATSKDMEISAYEGSCSTYRALEELILDMVRKRLQT